jgi:predicted DNA-binding transcriptional regulator YafY
VEVIVNQNNSRIILRENEKSTYSRQTDDILQFMNLEKVRIIDNYIRKNNTGRAKQFAEKVGISRGMLYRYLKFLKEELNAPIVYNKSKLTYSYSESGKLCISGWEKPFVILPKELFTNESSLNILNGDQKPK